MFSYGPNLRTAALWGYEMLPWGPTRSDERKGGVAREGQGYPWWRYDMMMMMMMMSWCTNSEARLSEFEPKYNEKWGRIWPQYSNQNIQQKLGLRWGRPKIIDSEDVLQFFAANLVSNIWRISGEPSISHSCEVGNIHDLGKIFEAAELCLTYYQNNAKLLTRTSSIVALCQNIPTYIYIHTYTPTYTKSIRRTLNLYYVFGHLPNLDKYLELLNCASHTIKILQNFWLILVYSN